MAEIAWTRVHAIINEAHARIIAIKWTRSKAYLVTRGASRSVQSSSQFDRVIRLHRTDVICRDGRYVVDGHDLPRSEALRGWSRFFAIGGVAWIH